VRARLAFPMTARTDSRSRLGTAPTRPSSSRPSSHITNPVDFASFTPLDVQAGSAAQEIGAKVAEAEAVNAFNATFAGTLLEAESPGSGPTS
jgi:hypothetical protein